MIHALSNPIKKTGGLVILRGSLAPDGCVIKVTGIERKVHTNLREAHERRVPAAEDDLERRIVAALETKPEARPATATMRTATIRPPTKP